MFRVIYKWKVDSDHLEQFKKIWAKTTTTIHKTVNGAKGSMFLKSMDDPTIIITIAKWDNYNSWKEFWNDSKPESMKEMHRLAKRITVEAYEEIEDFTV